MSLYLFFHADVVDLNKDYLTICTSIIKGYLPSFTNPKHFEFLIFENQYSPKSFLTCFLKKSFVLPLDDKRNEFTN